MTLLFDEQKRITELASGVATPVSGMEKHFLRVLAGKGTAATLKEKEWLEYWKDQSKQTKKKEVISPPTKEQDSVSAVKELLNSIDSRNTTKPSLFAKIAATVNLKPNHSTKRSNARTKVNKRQTSERNLSPPTRIPSTTDGSNNNHQKRYVDEGIAGTREDNKRMRGKLGSESRSRNK